MYTSKKNKINIIIQARPVHKLQVIMITGDLALEEEEILSKHTTPAKQSDLDEGGTSTVRKHRFVSLKVPHSCDLQLIYMTAQSLPTSRI